MSDRISITSGSDATLQFAFRDGAGNPLAVNSPTVLYPSGALDGRITATLVDGPNGLVSVLIEGTDPIPPGDYNIRLQVLLADNTTLASEKVTVHVR